MTSTPQQFDDAVASCRQTFLKKTADYGTSWRVYRMISIADQLYIKAKRVRNIQVKQSQKIGDDIQSEFQGILNYAVIGLMQLELENNEDETLTVEHVNALYDLIISRAKILMTDKNHDYGEAWREMSQESFIDLILAKLLRIKQIVANDGQTTISEGIDSNLYDILNYAAFGLILINEGKHSS